KTIALEAATSGITVNAICPGWVLTPLVQKQIDDRAAKDGIDVKQASNEMLREKQPSLQFTTPEQLGELTVFLCSPAADNVRGVAWAVDGGWTAQ
ncbi:MAG: SDR family oxidoreductase, partial [Rhizobacter sp.]|nr:SDR family oxidoreductase [Rhizobacter sp.]